MNIYVILNIEVTNTNAWSGQSDKSSGQKEANIRGGGNLSYMKTMVKAQRQIRADTEPQCGQYQREWWGAELTAELTV